MSDRKKLLILCVIAIALAVLMLSLGLTPLSCGTP